MFSNFARRYNSKGLRKFVISFQSNYSMETATFETKPFKLYKLDDGPSTTTTLTKADALDMYRKMETVRRLGTSAGNLYHEEFVRGFCHLYDGQEAVCVGFKAALKPSDNVITSYRQHGWAHMMGISPHTLLSELAGKESGCSRGKGGSMHMYCDHFYGGNGIVGAQVPLGVGLALATKYKNIDSVSLALYGDGAANQGQIFEVFNIAKLLDIPCVFVCENNGYGMSTSAERSSVNTAYYTRSDCVPGLWVDGMDVLACREAMRYARSHCTSGKGPIVLEAATYRYSGHSVTDPGTDYRTTDEIQEVRQTRDPISSFKEKILNANLVTTEELRAIEREIIDTIDDATKKSKTGREIGLNEITADIYTENLEGNIRSMTPFDTFEHKRIGAAVNL